MHLTNSKNLGDNLLQLNFMRKACLANRQLEIDYYCNAGHHSQLVPFIDDVWKDQIRLHSYVDGSPAYPVNFIDTWIAGELLPGFYWNHPKRHLYNEFYFEWFKKLAERMGIPSPIKSPKEVALDHPVFEDFSPIENGQFRESYHGLIIDCEPKSGQFNFDRKIWDVAKKTWHDLWAIASVHDTPLTLTQVGLLARRSDVVVAVCTGPLHAAFNTRALETVKRWYVFHAAHSYSYVPQIVACRDNKDLFKVLF